MTAEAVVRLREVLRKLLDIALAALRSPELERIALELHSPAVLIGAPPVAGQALRRLDRIERIVSAGG